MTKNDALRLFDFSAALGRRARYTLDLRPAHGIMVLAYWVAVAALLRIIGA